MRMLQTVSLPHVCRTLRFIKITSDCRCDNDINSLACHSISNPYSLGKTIRHVQIQHGVSGYPAFITNNPLMDLAGSTA
jgi:hypothetical protein